MESRYRFEEIGIETSVFHKGCRWSRQREMEDVLYFRYGGTVSNRNQCNGLKKWIIITATKDSTIPDLIYFWKSSNNATIPMDYWILHGLSLKVIKEHELDKLQMSAINIRILYQLENLDIPRESRII